MGTFQSECSLTTLPLLPSHRPTSPLQLSHTPYLLEYLFARFIRIQETLLHALNASPQNWPTLIQNHALTLLRSGECTTFPVLMSRVLSDIKSDTQLRDSTSSTSTNSLTTNGTKGKKKEDEARNGKGENGQSLALPKNVVDEGVRITRECLELVCEVVE